MRRIDHHGSRRPRLPQLQRGVPRRPETSRSSRSPRRRSPGSTIACTRPSLAGPRYPHGIPIRPEEELTELVRAPRASTRSCSPTPTSRTRRSCTRRRSCSPPARTSVSWGPTATMLHSTKPVVAVCADAHRLRQEPDEPQGRRDPARRRLRSRSCAIRCRTATSRRCACSASRRSRRSTPRDPTVEEREEYEEPVRLGMVMYAGVDYAAILRQAEEEADVIVWDGGNNDFPFYRARPADRRRRPAAAGPRAPLPPRRDEPADGRRRRASTRSTRPRRTTSSRCSRTSSRVNPMATLVFAESPPVLEPGPDLRGKRRARRRRRADPHPRRHAVRRRARRGPQGGRGADRRSAAVPRSARSRRRSHAGRS